MKSQPILFFAAIDDERERCPHGNLRPMPKTREQREAEREQFNRRFFFWCGLAYVFGIGLVLGYMCARGGR